MQNNVYRAYILKVGSIFFYMRQRVGLLLGLYQQGLSLSQWSSSWCHIGHYNSKFKINQIQFKNYKINPKNPGIVGKPFRILQEKWLRIFSMRGNWQRVNSSVAARKSKQTGVWNNSPLFPSLLAEKITITCNTRKTHKQLILNLF